MSAQTQFERQEVKRLIALMRDPRYWRDGDLEMQRMVRDGFERLYGRPEAYRRPALRARSQQAA